MLFGMLGAVGVLDCCFRRGRDQWRGRGSLRGF